MPSIGREKVNAVFFAFVLVLSLPAMSLMGGFDSGVAEASTSEISDEDYEVIEEIPDNTDRIHGIHESPDGEYVAAIDNDGNVFIYETGSYSLVEELQANDDGYQIRFSPDSETLAFTGDGTLHVHEVGSWNEITQEDTHDDGRVRGLRWTHSGDRVIAGDDGMYLNIYDGDSFEKIEEFQPDGADSFLHALDISPDDRYVSVSDSNDESVHVVDLDTYETVETISGYDRVTDIDFTSDSSEMVVVESWSDDGIFRHEVGEDWAELDQGFAGAGGKLSISPDDSLIAFDDDEDIHVTDRESLEDSTHLADTESRAWSIHWAEATGNLYYGDSENFYVMETEFDGLSENLTGQVTDQHGDPIDQALVEFFQEDELIDSDQTDSGGEFGVNVENGTYDIEISASGYQTKTVTQEVEEGDHLTFELQETAFELSAPDRMDPNSNASYTAYFDLDDIRLKDVTENTTVESANETILEIDEEEHKLISHETNGSVNITATYVYEGETFNATHEVVVAPLEVGHLPILPESSWIPAVLLDSTIQMIGAGLLLGFVAGRLTQNPWAALGTAELVLTLGWMMGLVGTGIMIVSIFYLVLAGLAIADVYRPR